MLQNVGWVPSGVKIYVLGSCCWVGGWSSVFGGRYHYRSTTPLACSYTTWWNISVLKVTIKKKAISVTTHSKNEQQKQSVYCLSYCLQQLSHLAVFSSKLFNVSVLWMIHSSRRCHWPMARSSKCSKFAPLREDRLLQLVDCGELSTLIDHLLKDPWNSIIDRI